MRDLLLKAIILPITLLFLSESFADNNDIYDDEPIEEPSIERSVLNFKENNGLELKVSYMEDISFGFVHTGLYSPEGNVVIGTIY